MNRSSPFSARNFANKLQFYACSAVLCGTAPAAFIGILATAEQPTLTNAIETSGFVVVAGLAGLGVRRAMRNGPGA